MRNLIVGIFLILGLTSFINPISDEIIAALKVGDAEKLATHFNKSIDLSIPENEGVFSSTQAKLILTTFFEKNQPSKFTVVHNGDSKNNSHYSIGNLITSNGNYRTYILYKEIEKITTIIELRIETEE